MIIIAKNIFSFMALSIQLKNQITSRKISVNTSSDVTAADKNNINNEIIISLSDMCHK